METSERSRLIMHTLLQMEKQFGKGSVQQLGSRNVLPVNVISTGSISLDAGNCSSSRQYAAKLISAGAGVPIPERPRPTGSM